MPALLITLRLVQGAGAGAEYAGAVLVAAEYAPPGKRGFFSSLPSVGYFDGVLLATGLFAAVAQLPDEQFAAWGWRSLFWLSAVIVAVGIWMRLKLLETPSSRPRSPTGPRSPLRSSR
jgi:MFS family permease